MNIKYTIIIMQAIYYIYDACKFYNILNKRGLLIIIIYMGYDKLCTEKNLVVLGIKI
jgi:hypothetical protein